MDRHSNLIGKIFEIPDLKDAMRVAFDEEIAHIVNDLRNNVVSGNPTAAAICEGKLQAFGEAVDLLTRFAKKAATPLQE